MGLRGRPNLENVLYDFIAEKLLPLDIGQIAMQTMTLQDGSVIRVGDRVRAQCEDGRWRVCGVQEIRDGPEGVEQVVLAAPGPFGTVVRAGYQVRSTKWLRKE